MTHPKRHRDPNQFAKSITLRPSRRLVELGLKCEGTKCIR
jgi:hypothetical protein